MKASNSSNSFYFSNENYDFRPFSDTELDVIMGGGGDDMAIEFPQVNFLTEDDLYDE